MSYYNYHAKIKKLIMEGELEGYKFVDDYHGIRPALVLYFKNNRPMPIRDYRWEEYIPLLMMQNDIVFEDDNNSKNINKIN